MSNLAQYRLWIGFFSFGLLWAASEVVGDSDKPGPLAAATKTMVHRLKSHDDGTAVRTDDDYDLAVSETDFSDREASSHNAFAPDAAASEGAADLASSPAQAEPEAAAVAPPDVGVIHK